MYFTLNYCVYCNSQLYYFKFCVRRYKMYINKRNDYLKYAIILSFLFCTSRVNLAIIIRKLDKVYVSSTCMGRSEGYVLFIKVQQNLIYTRWLSHHIVNYYHNLASLRSDQHVKRRNPSLIFNQFVQSFLFVVKKKYLHAIRGPIKLSAYQHRLKFPPPPLFYPFCKAVIEMRFDYYSGVVHKRGFSRTPVDSTLGLLIKLLIRSGHWI